ncbi:unnamed protein product, partial [Sphagnum tenellum]
SSNTNDEESRCRSKTNREGEINSYGKTTLQSDAAAAKQMVKKYSTPIAKQPYKNSILQQQKQMMELRNEI